MSEQSSDEAGANPSAPQQSDGQSPSDNLATPQSSSRQPPLSKRASHHLAAAAAASFTPHGTSSSNASHSTAPAQLSVDDARAAKLFDRWQKAFLGAIETSSEDYILAMLKEGEDLVWRGKIDLNRSIKPASGSTFLHTAAWFQKAAVMKWLLTHGADPNRGNLKGNTPLHLLCEQANKGTAPELIQLMVDFGGAMDLKDGVGMSGAEKAAAVGFDLASIQYERGREFLARKSRGITGPELYDPTHGVDGAGTGGSGGAVAAGGEGMDADGSGMGVLSSSERAAAVEKSKLVYRKLSTLFMGLDAQVSQSVDDAITRLISTNLSLIHHKLLDLNRPSTFPEGSDPSTDGKTFLHYAVAARRAELVRVLLMQGDAEPNRQDETGETPLHLAIQQLDTPSGVVATMISLLLDAGASKTITSYLRGSTPMQMVSSRATVEAKKWLYAYKPKPMQKLTSTLVAQKVLGGGTGLKSPSAASAGSGSATPAAGGSVSRTTSGISSTPVAGFGSMHSSGVIEEQDRAGARAMMARMKASVMGATGGGMGMGMGMGAATVSPGSNNAAATTSTTPRTSVLGLIQKGSNASPAVTRDSSRRGSGALQSMLAKSKSVAGGVGAGSSRPSLINTPSVPSSRAVTGTTLGLGGKKLLNEKALRLADLFNQLDEDASGSLSPATVSRFHEQLHVGCSGVPSWLVQHVFGSSVPSGQCIRSNFLGILSHIHLACCQYASLRWEFAMMDIEGVGSIDAQDMARSGMGSCSPAELVWSINHIDAAQTRMEDFIVRKLKSDKSRPKEIKLHEIQQELLGKMANMQTTTTTMIG